MIEKTIVQRIIEENDKTLRLSKKDDILSCENLAFSPERKKLVEYIAALPRDQLIDLVVLMEQGREILHLGTDYQISVQLSESRKRIAENFQQSTSEQIAIYLLEKGKFLSEYLRRSMPLLDDEFVF